MIGPDSYTIDAKLFRKQLGLELSAFERSYIALQGLRIQKCWLRHDGCAGHEDHACHEGRLIGHKDRAGHEDQEGHRAEGFSWKSRQEVLANRAKTWVEEIGFPLYFLIEFRRFFID